VAPPVRAPKETMAVPTLPVAAEEYIDISEVEQQDREHRALAELDVMEEPVASTPLAVSATEHNAMPDNLANAIEPSATSREQTTLPLLDQLDLSLRQRIPEMSLDVHVYTPEAANRFVLINMKRYREGEQTQEGLLVEAIEPRGVILSLEGHAFRLLP
ncbi:MAG: hypothetical protein FD130_318, partial [Halothiobacillaceae bacterium]